MQRGSVRVRRLPGNILRTVSKRDLRGLSLITGIAIQEQVQAPDVLVRPVLGASYRKMTIQAEIRDLLTSCRMVAVSRAQVKAALASLEPGLRKYCSIQIRLSCCDVSLDRDFQRQFDHFYRVRRNEEWRGSFFRLMEGTKCCGISLQQALNALQRENGKFEVSFASKLVATIDPANRWSINTF